MIKDKRELGTSDNPIASFSNTSPPTMSTPSMSLSRVPLPSMYSVTPQTIGRRNRWITVLLGLIRSDIYLMLDEFDDTLELFEPLART